MKKKMASLLLCISCVLIFSGCSQKQEENGTKVNKSKIEIAQNDYAGAYNRATIIQNDVVNSMSHLDTNNLTVQEGNPDDYWSEDNYYFLHFLPVFTEELDDIKMLNENDNWIDIQEYIKKVLVDKGYNEGSISILRNDMNQYTVKYGASFLHPKEKSLIYGVRELNIIYDASANCFQVVSYITFHGEKQPTFDFFYEFAEIAPYTYIFQNNSERMFVKYKDQAIIYFAYSDLMRNTSIVTKESTDEENEIKEEIIYGYNVEERSCFSRLNEINENWVTEANGNFEKLIIYTQKETLITTTNVLTKEKSTFSIANIEIPQEQTKMSEEESTKE